MTCLLEMSYGEFEIVGRDSSGVARDPIDPNARGQWTSSVQNHQATAEEVTGGRLPSGK